VGILFVHSQSSALQLSSSDFTPMDTDTPMKNVLVRDQRKLKLLTLVAGLTSIRNTVCCLWQILESSLTSRVSDLYHLILR
jgi:hypothetical protein